MFEQLAGSFSPLLGSGSYQPNSLNQEGDHQVDDHQDAQTVERCEIDEGPVGCDHATGIHGHKPIVDDLFHGWSYGMEVK